MEETQQDSYATYRKTFQNAVRQTMRNRFNDMQAAESNSNPK
jgi:hypothetical protein